MQGNLRQSAPFRRVRERLPGVPELRTRSFGPGEDPWYSYKLTALDEADLAHRA